MVDTQYLIESFKKCWTVKDILLVIWPESLDRYEGETNALHRHCAMIDINELPALEWVEQIIGIIQREESNEYYTSEVLEELRIHLYVLYSRYFSKPINETLNANMVSEIQDVSTHEIIPKIELRKLLMTDDKAVLLIKQLNQSMLSAVKQNKTSIEYTIPNTYYIALTSKLEDVGYKISTHTGKLNGKEFRVTISWY